MSIWGDIFSGQALAGAGSGAVAGGEVGGPWGALAGGIAGLGLGAYAHDAMQSATNNQVNNLSKIANNMRSLTSASYAQHISDLNKALSFYGPAQSYWSRLYGQGTGALTTGNADWGATGITPKV